MIDYLDLEIFKVEDGVCTRTFFKTTDQKGYIPTSSCHHPKWKCNIPKGQLLRIRRNFDSVEHFNTQADILIQRFYEKGYALDNLVKLKMEILNMDRKDLLWKKIRNANNQKDVAFITGFNSQYKDFERIMRKYWPILREDGVLSNILPNKPKFVYRKALTLRNHLVHNVIDPPKPINIFPDMKGLYRCQRCLPCKASKKQPKKKQSFKSFTDHKEYQIKQ